MAIEKSYLGGRDKELTIVNNFCINSNQYNAPVKLFCPLTPPGTPLGISIFWGCPGPLITLFCPVLCNY